MNNKPTVGEVVVEDNNKWNIFSRLMDYLEEMSSSSASHVLDTALNMVVEELNPLAPPFTYFGSYQYNWAFWPNWNAMSELKHYGPKDELPDSADDYYVFVNDHANTTLYDRNGNIVWDVV